MNKTCDVLVVGAGPVGLTLANLLGQQGIDVLVVEREHELIDYPRAVGIDDEALRAMQTVGLVDEVLPHTIPDQKIYMINGDGTVLSEVNPTTREFGWPRRNGFVQPLVDQVLLAGLDRFPNTSVRFGTEVVDLTEDTPASSPRSRTVARCVRGTPSPPRAGPPPPANAWASPSRARPAPPTAS